MPPPMMARTMQPTTVSAKEVMADNESTYLNESATSCLPKPHLLDVSLKLCSGEWSVPRFPGSGSGISSGVGTRVVFCLPRIGAPLLLWSAPKQENRKPGETFKVHESGLLL